MLFRYPIFAQFERFALSFNRWQLCDPLKTQQMTDLSVAVTFQNRVPFFVGKGQYGQILQSFHKLNEFICISYIYGVYVWSELLGRWLLKCLWFQFTAFCHQNKKVIVIYPRKQTLSSKLGCGFTDVVFRMNTVKTVKSLRYPCVT